MTPAEHDAEADRPTTDPGYRLEYVISHEAWYAQYSPDPDPSITVSKAHHEGGVAWEFSIVDRRRTIGKPAIQVKVFDDAFATFTELAPLFRRLAHEQPTTLDEVEVILTELGFVDVTARTDPEAAGRRAAKLRADAAQLIAQAEALEAGPSDA